MYKQLLEQRQKIAILLLSDTWLLFAGPVTYIQNTHMHTHTHICIYICVHIIIKTHGSESRGQEEVACTRVFWPTRPLQ